MKYDIFLLDADQTVFDFDKSEKNAIKDVLLNAGLPFNDEVYLNYRVINKYYWNKYERSEIEKEDIFKNRFKTLFKECNFKCDEDLNIHYFKKLAENAYLLEGAEKFLQDLSCLGKVYLATNGRDFIQNSRINLSGISKYLKGVFVSEKVGYAKPRKEFFEYIENNVDNFNKQKTVMIGDGLSSDILGGNNFGIDTIWLNLNKEKTIEIIPTYEVHSYEEILKIIKNA
jgi:YjjG family noncanonical pyrimidine nucleotidase